jgi:hypothetical protein
MALADVDNDGTYSEDELNALTKTELLALANDLGVEGVSTKSLKADIVTAILNR